MLAAGVVGGEWSQLSGPALRAALHAQVRGHTVIPYSSSRFDTADALRQLDGALDGTNAVVRLIYGNGTAPAGAFGVTGGWNREHLWPNSYGLDDVEPAFSDLHNLRACDANVNSSRGNKWFDLSDPADGPVARPGHPEAPGTSADPNSWQPPAHQRGDIARALFYMDVRYEGDATNEPDLVLTEDIGRVSSTNRHMGRLSLLFWWHIEDPPDDRERARNAAVAALQGNRNPFIDEPSLVERLWLPRFDAIPKIWELEGRAYPLVSHTGLPFVLEYSRSLDSGEWLEWKLVDGQYPLLAPVFFGRVRALPHRVELP